MHGRSYGPYLRRLNTMTPTTAATAITEIAMISGRVKFDPLGAAIEFGVMTAGSNANPVLSLYLKPSNTTVNG